MTFKTCLEESLKRLSGNKIKNRIDVNVDVNPRHSFQNYQSEYHSANSVHESRNWPSGVPTAKI